jgi:hypothetical protein
MRRWLERVPRRGVTLATLAALFIAVELAFFPGTTGAGVALILLVAAAGAGAAWLRAGLRTRAWPRAETRATRRSLGECVLVTTLVVAASACVWGPAFQRGGYSRYDWAPHHANLRHLVDALARGDGVPRWVQSVATGESPYELYPLFPDYLTARVALLFHVQDLTLLLVRSGILIYTLGAVGAALLARRVVSWKWGIFVGLAVLLDFGSLFGGGASGVLYLGVVHSTLALSVWPFVMLALINALERPSLVTSASIWLLTAFALLCHPIGLVAALATAGTLVLVACLARDVPRHRVLFALGHLALGVGLVACVWRPFSQRVLLYGLHYAWTPDAAGHFFGDLLQNSQPQATFAPLVYVAYVGMLVGLLSRRAAPTLVACYATILLSGLVDQLYLSFHLAPSLETARMQVSRFASMTKASVYVSAAYLLAGTWARVAPLWRDRARYLGAAILAALAFPFARGAVAYTGELERELAAQAHPDVPDAAGFRALIAWARSQKRAERPDAYARLLSDDTERYYSVCHVNAESGLPALWLGDTSQLFLRERIEDESPASLRRFDVRWVMHHGAPPSAGDPATERRFGSYFVREVPEWDGRFARVERGAGNAVVTRLDDDRIDVELRDAPAPALVVLGMGYYPRWEAAHETRGKLDVYAYPTIPGGNLRVVAAWLPPGHTVFRPSGTLPSDGGGSLASVLALLAAGASSVVWRVARLRQRVLRGFAVAARFVRRERATLATLGAVVSVIALLGWSFTTARRPTAALEVGSGLVPLARVEERQDGGFRACAYSWLSGQFRCPSGALVFDAEAQVLNDAPPSPAFVSPVVRLSARSTPSELRLVFEPRLQGEYWARAAGTTATLAVAGMPGVTLDESQVSLIYPSKNPAREVVLETRVDARGSADISLVRTQTLEPVRNYPQAPDANPLPGG